jgi:hypothetical protein
MERVLLTIFQSGRHRQWTLYLNGEGVRSVGVDETGLIKMETIKRVIINYDNIY